MIPIEEHPRFLLVFLIRQAPIVNIIIVPPVLFILDILRQIQRPAGIHPQDRQDV